MTAIFQTSYMWMYIYLMQKGDIPHHQKLPYSPVNKRREHKKGSVYLIARARDKRSNKTGSVTVNFYDKYLQKLNEQVVTMTVTDAEVEQARNILRLEIQCFLPKISSLKNKYKLSDTRLEQYLSDDICFISLGLILFVFLRRPVLTIAFVKSTFPNFSRPCFFILPPIILLS